LVTEADFFLRAVVVWSTTLLALKEFEIELIGKKKKREPKTSTT